MFSSKSRIQCGTLFSFFLFTNFCLWTGRKIVLFLLPSRMLGKLIFKEKRIFWVGVFGRIIFPSQNFFCRRLKIKLFHIIYKLSYRLSSAKILQIVLWLNKWKFSTRCKIQCSQSHNCPVKNFPGREVLNLSKKFIFLFLC